MRILHAEDILLIIKSLTDCHSLLRPRAPFLAQQMGVAGDVQVGCKLHRDDPRGIKMPNNPLTPVLRNREDAINLQSLQFGMLMSRQKSAK